ncbi:MAG TPA: hypothetical protein VK916_02200 [Gillisia sp.]|nr:hypothetical protein [Gillisia sp.]
MKIRFLNKIFPLLLLAFINVHSGIASSFSPATLDLNSRNYDYLQEDQNRLGLLFQEISITTSFQEILKNNPVIGGIVEYSTGGLSIPASKISNSTGYLLDKRSALNNQIFPFHFFW